jgi:hypothetical protein
MGTSVGSSASGYDVAAESRRTLSKSDFKLARSCEAKLYFRENHYPDNQQLDHYLRLLQRGGYMVEALAKARYPDAVQLAYGRNVADDFARTMEELQRENVTLFEATLLVGRRLARVDILEKRGNRVRLIEVKSSTFDGARHAADVARGKPGEFRKERKPHGVRAEWLDYFEDLTFQVLLLERLLPSAKIEPWLALLDKSKRAAVDDIPTLFEIVRDGDRLHTARYIGTREQYAELDLITEIHVAAEVDSLREDVETYAADLEARLDAPLESFLIGLERGAKCSACEFRHEPPEEKDGFRACWGELADSSPHMLDLYAIGKVKAVDGRSIIQSLFESGQTSLFDIPEDRLAKANGEVGPLALRQRRQIEFTRRGEAFLDPALRASIEALPGPIHFIDFEAARLALPYHARMRTYGLLAFQWSAHTILEKGDRPAHREWLNADDGWPNEAFAETLRTAIGDEGPVLTWSSFETTTLKQIAEEMPLFGRHSPELLEWMDDVIDRRTVDMYRWCTDWYYHPRMGGSASIKRVLDAMWRTDPALRAQFESLTGSRVDAFSDPYASLPPISIAGELRYVQEGTGAVLAYEEMMYGISRHDRDQRNAWGKLLKRYCELDTLSMVLIFDHWRRLTGIA